MVKDMVNYLADEWLEELPNSDLKFLIDQNSSES
jgi:hypothetical protein